MGVKFPIFTHRYRSQWEAVKHLVRAAAATKNTSRPVSRRRFTRQVIDIQKQWIARGNAIRRAGWSRAMIAPRIVARCPSPFNLDDSDRRPCHQCLTCPNCWCREVVDKSYLRARDVIFAAGLSKTPLVGSLLFFKATRAYDLDRVDIHLALRQVASRYAAYRVASRQCSIGQMSCVTLEPGGDHAMVAQHRFALMTEETQLDGMTSMLSSVVTANDDTELVYRHVDFPITKAKLAFAIGWLYRYPTGLLTGDPEAAVAILEALKHPAVAGARLRGSAGVFYTRVT